MIYYAFFLAYIFEGLAFIGANVAIFILG